MSKKSQACAELKSCVLKGCFTPVMRLFRILTPSLYIRKIPTMFWWKWFPSTTFSITEVVAEITLEDRVLKQV